MTDFDIELWFLGHSKLKFAQPGIDRMVQPSLIRALVLNSRKLVTQVKFITRI